MQLVAYGAQDIFLTGNPQVTWFKKIYKRHSNFATESIEQTFNGTVDFGKKATVTVSRNGDLITKCYVQAVIPDVTFVAKGWVPELGHFLLKTVEVEIGGQRIDKHYGTWLSIWSSLTTPTGKQTGYLSMIGNDLEGAVSATVTGKTIYVPLQFWFCRHEGLALPLIALQYHEVKINIEFATVAELTTAGGSITGGTPSLGETSLWIDYVFLDTQERQRMAQAPHEYLIEQLQFTGDESMSGTNNTTRLSFNHPVKELVWVIQDDARVANNFTDDDAGTGENPVATAHLQLNGHERFRSRAGDYFNKVQPYQCHTNVPAQGINVYSFALHPEDHQPTGSLNMSRIDNATLKMALTAAGGTGASNPVLKVFAVNYNILRLKSGMGGLAYSN